MTGLPMLAAGPWQMSFGERAALEGVVAQLQPRLAVEIGTAEGGSLRRIAAHSEEVHSFDLVPPDPGLASIENAHFHTGDSHELLPRFLAELDASGRTVDFALVDGDHTADGARRDILDLLGSAAVSSTVILAHDTMNDEVREGLESVDYASYEKVALVELDFLSGYLARAEPYRLQLWGGLGLIVVDDASGAGVIRDRRFHSLLSLVRPMRDVMVEVERSGSRLDEAAPAEVEEQLRESIVRAQREADDLRVALERCRAVMQDLQGSASWRLTAPLRSAKRARQQWRARP